MSDYINGKKETDTVIDFYSIYITSNTLLIVVYFVAMMMMMILLYVYMYDMLYICNYNIITAYTWVCRHTTTTELSKTMPVYRSCLKPVFEMTAENPVTF